MKGLILLSLFMTTASIRCLAGDEVIKDRCGLFALKQALETAPSHMNGEDYLQKKVSVDILNAFKAHGFMKDSVETSKYIITVGFSGLNQMELDVTVLYKEPSQAQQGGQCVLASSKVHTLKKMANYNRVPATQN